MKRKVYVTARERRADQIKGFLACPIANVLLWVIWPVIYSQALTQVAATDRSSFPPVQALSVALPWLVNGSVLALAFVFRPQFGIGYVAFIAVAIMAASVLNCLFVAACFVAVTLWGNSINLPMLEVFAILTLGGLCVLGLAALILVRIWRSSHKKSEETGETKD